MKYEIPQDPELPRLWISDEQRGPREFVADTRKGADGYREVVLQAPEKYTGGWYSWSELLELGPVYDTPPKLSLIELRMSESNGEGTFLIDSDTLTRIQRTRVLQAVASFLDIVVVSHNYLA